MHASVRRTKIWSCNSQPYATRGVGTPGFFEILPQGHAPRAQAWLRLCDLSLQHVFDVVVTFDDTRERKPSPAPFREVLRRLEADPSEALMVGDWAERDVVGGKSLGMKTVFARYGDTFGTQNSGADYDVDDVFQLVAIVDELRAIPARPP